MDETPELDFSRMPTAPDSSSLPPIAIFRTPPRDAVAEALACSGAGMQRTGSWLDGRRLDGYAAVLVDEGAGWLESEAAGRIRVVAPALFWLFPGDRHSYGPDPGTLWHEQWVLFTGTLASAFAATGRTDRSRPVVALDHAGDLSGPFGRIRRELSEDGPLGQAAAALAVHQLVIEAGRIALRRDRLASAPAIAAIAAVIRDQTFRTIDFDALARRNEMSPATLRRQMVAAYGISPKAYQLQLRLDRAKALLALDDMRIEYIASAVGFDDAYYFSRLFRKREGMAPSAFRAANRRA